MVSGKGEFSEAYRRCAAVLLKLMQLSSAKFFIWSINRDEMEEYFDTIQRPIMLFNVATHLLMQAYEMHLTSDSDVISDTEVYSMFYHEVTDVFTNCYTFNTEVQSIVAQGQKAQLAFFRLLQQWILNGTRPELQALSETMECGICLLSQKPLEPMVLMKCGHCCGQFHLGEKACVWGV